MKSSTGRWVSGPDFFDRESELRVLDERVRAGNHVLLTGQRRMGKTSLARELGRRLESAGWVFLFADVEGATCPEDVIADLAQAAHPHRARLSRFATGMRRLVSENLEELSAYDFRVKVRAGVEVGTWRRHGEGLIHDCVAHDRRVLLVIDELPIFLKRVLRKQSGTEQVDAFLSWLRGAVQGIGDGIPGSHRIRQYRTRAAGATARHVRPHQPSRSVSSRTLGSRHQRRVPRASCGRS